MGRMYSPPASGTGADKAHGGESQTEEKRKGFSKDSELALSSRQTRDLELLWEEPRSCSDSGKYRKKSLVSGQAL